jgi:hypothetical protein
MSSVLDSIGRFWTRATGIVDGADAMLKIGLPAARAWVTRERLPRLVWERLVGDAWVPCTFNDLDATTCDKVRIAIATRGWSLRDDVVGAVQDSRGLTIYFKDGRSLYVG